MRELIEICRQENKEPRSAFWLIISTFVGADEQAWKKVETLRKRFPKYNYCFAHANALKRKWEGK